MKTGLKLDTPFELGGGGGGGLWHKEKQTTCNNSYLKSKNVSDKSLEIIPCAL